MSVVNQYYVYILFSKRNGTLYTGVTSDIVKRVWEHKNKIYKGFTSKYEVDKLGYYEIYNDINLAIDREKQLKGGNRKQKLKLIETINPNWDDLYDKIIKQLDCFNLITFGLAMTCNVSCHTIMSPVHVIARCYKRRSNPVPCLYAPFITWIASLPLVVRNDM